jgi:DNA-binding response OmpR family regulator
MAPSFNSVVVPLEEVPFDLTDGDASTRTPVVLVVDDEPMVTDTLAAILMREGFHTMKAYDGRTALNLARAVAPDLLITDVAMPQMDGVELAIRLVAGLPSCKVILFSGHATCADVILAHNAGLQFPLLTKPVHPSEMLRHIRETLKMPERVEPLPHHAEVIPIRGTLAIA